MPDAPNGDGSPFDRKLDRINDTLANMTDGILLEMKTARSRHELVLEEIRGIYRPAARTAQMTQTSLLCGCGGPLPCERCERRQRLNRERYAGLRELVLSRDEQCRICGALDDLVVHHRRPGRNELATLITLCRPCHVRVHLLHRPGYAVVREVPLLYALWLELHKRQPEQRLLFMPVQAEQKVLFANAG